MLKIAIVVPFKEMEKQVHTAWAMSESENQSSQLGIYDDEQFEYTVDVLTHTVGSEPKYKDADVIVARGASALALKKYYADRDTHVVEIPVTPADLVTTIRRAASRYGNLPIGITGTYNMTYGSRGVIRSSRYDVRVYHSDKVSERSYEAMVDSAMRDGRKIIIGGVHSVEYARSLGLRAEKLTSCVESILQAITAAKSAALIAARERSRASLYEAIIKNTYSGILSFNKKNEVVAINDSARLLLGVKSRQVNAKTLDELLSPGQFKQLLIKGDCFKDTIAEHRGNTFVVSKAKIPLGDNDFAYLATFQDAAAFVQYINNFYELSKGFSPSENTAGSFDNIIGSSPGLRGAVSRAKSLADTGGSILITGESGTGKSTFARAIHNHRLRTGQFVSVDCAGLTLQKLRGGDNQPGVFELANGGTIFLRELAALPAQLQGEAMDIISSMSTSRLDSDHTVPLSLHIISSTSRDLEALVHSGAFSARLYYTISENTIEVPPLRSRPGDVPELFEHILTQRLGKPPPGIRSGARRLLMSHKWYGNMHELIACCDRLSAIPARADYTEANIAQCVLRASQPELDDDELGIKLEKKKILDTLYEHSFNRTDAAKALSMSRTTLWRKMKKHGIAD